MAEFTLLSFQRAYVSSSHKDNESGVVSLVIVADENAPEDPRQRRLNFQCTQEDLVQLAHKFLQEIGPAPVLSPESLETLKSIDQRVRLLLEG